MSLIKSVYKWPFSLRETKFSLHLPIGWKLLRVAMQNDRPCIWAEVFDGAERKDFSFEVFGTGQEIPETATWLATYDVGPFVFHLYQL